MVSAAEELDILSVVVVVVVMLEVVVVVMVAVVGVCKCEREAEESFECLLVKKVKCLKLVEAGDGDDGKAIQDSGGGGHP